MFMGKLWPHVMSGMGKKLIRKMFITKCNNYEVRIYHKTAWMKYDLPNCMSHINRVVLNYEKYWKWRQITQAWSYRWKRACEGVQKEETSVHSTENCPSLTKRLLSTKGCQWTVVFLYCLLPSFDSWKDHGEIWQHKTITGINDQSAVWSFLLFSFSVCVCVHVCLLVSGRGWVCLVVWVLFLTESTYIQNSCNT